MKSAWKTVAYATFGFSAILAVTAGISNIVTPINPLSSDVVIEVPGRVIEENLEKLVREHRDMMERKVFDLFPSANDAEALSKNLPLVEGFNNYMNGLPEGVKPMWSASLLLLGTTDEGVGIGSAFVVRIKRNGSRILGYLMTNNHVIRDFCDWNGECPNLYTLNDIGINTRTGEVFRTGSNVLKVQGAKVIKTTNPPDLALLEVELTEESMAFLKIAAVNVNDATAGTAVYAIGFPNTSVRTSSSAKPIDDQTLVIKRWSEGVVERTIHVEGYEELLVHTADILPGNSGSGLFNRSGTVIGVNVLLMNVRKDFDYNGGGCNVPATSRASVAPRMLAPYMSIVNSL